MSLTITLANLRLGIRRRGGWVNAQNPSDAFLTDVVNSAGRELWDLMIGRWADYYVTRTNLAVALGGETIAVPSNFYKHRKLELLTNGTVDAAAARYRRLRPIDLQASHRPMYGVRDYRYRYAGNTIYLAPFAAQAETIRLHYIPCFTTLVSDGDTFDGINGYEELLMNIAVRRVFVSLDLPTGEVDNEIERLTKLVRINADSRDAEEPFYLDPAGPPGDYTDDYEDGYPWP